MFREATVRSLRHHSLLRTNQFDVDSRVAGLVERFRVQHREGLADALSERLGVFSQQSSKWQPELLHFLLELSDQPTQKSKLDDLELLRAPEEEIPPPLTWEDIAKEDGWDQDPGIWRSIDYSDSSDGDVYHGGDGSSAVSDTSSVLDQPSRGKQPEDFIVTSNDRTAFERVQESQEWRDADPVPDSEGRMRKVPVTEFHVVREVLFMLHGLPTSLFDTEIRLVSTYQLTELSWDAHRAVLTSFAESGRRLKTLRTFAKLPQNTALLQVFRDCVERSLRTLDGHLSAIETRFVATHDDVVVSLIALQDELRPPLQPLNSLSEIVLQLLEEPNVGPFKHLELLFEQVGISQLGGSTPTFDLLARMFFDCFQVYLRPIRQWMEDGHLIPGDRIFFVSESSTQVPLSYIWQSQYKLRRTPDGKLHAPKFLQPSAGKIFKAGKSIVVLKQLGKYAPFQASQDQQEPRLDFNTVYSKDLELAPFSELFHIAFDGWIQSKHQTTSETLKRNLFDSCGLWLTLNALETIYFMSDGSVADLFANQLFRMLDSQNPRWHDRYALSGLAQEAFSGKLDAYRVSVAVSAEGARKPLVAARGSVKTALPEVSISYRMAWPVQIVVSGESITRYQAVFTFLLQLRRSFYVLNGNRHLHDRGPAQERDAESDLYFSLRANLLWFCNAMRTYLATLVLAPSSAKLRDDLNKAHDVDAMIQVHSAFTKRVLDESCLGSKLEPIREAMLDLLDLALKLEGAHALNAQRVAEEMQELSRLSIMSSPRRARQRRYVDDSEDGELPLSQHGDGVARGDDEERTYLEVLREVQSEFDRHLRFIVGGLRAVARATSDTASGRWDILAEMLDVGVKGER